MAWKSRKFLLHLRLSKNDNFIHDHELYEMMRSRQLYNIHKDLRKNLGRTIRGIQNAERIHLANIEAKRLLFLQQAARKAKERLKLTQIPREPEDQSFEEDGGNRPFINQVSSVPVTGVAGVGQLPGFVARGSKGVGESPILPALENTRTKYQQISAAEKDRQVYRDLLPDTPKAKIKSRWNEETLTADAHDSVRHVFDSVRQSRIHTMREYTQLLDRRVRDFTVCG